MTNRDEANLYRTRWLMAHNAVHDIVIDGADQVARREEYLQELKTAKTIAKRSA